MFKLPYPNLKLGSVSLMEYLGEFPNARNRGKLESEIRGKRKQRIKKVNQRHDHNFLVIF